MRIGCLAAISLVAVGLSTPAAAADISVPAPSSQEPTGIASPSRDWTGIYLGVLLGFSFGQSDVDPGSVVDIDGADGGIYAGYNYQFNNWMAGVEADAQLSDFDGGDAASNAGQDWSASIRLRAGYSLESFLLYGTGGLSASGTEVSSGKAKDNETQFGWTVGAGIERMLTESLTARVEYRYSDYEDKVFSLGAPATADLSTNSLRAGVGVRF